MTAPAMPSRGRRTRATLLVALVAVPLLVSTLAGAYLDLPDMRTGAPGEMTCAGCHGSYGLNTGGGYIMVSGLPEKYEPSNSYVLTCTVYSPDAERWLFEITVKATTDGAPVGSFTLIDSTQTQLSGRYIKNTRAGCGGAVDGMKSWNFQWNAPSMADSDLMFYGVGMGSNGDGTGGDHVYTCKMKVAMPPDVPCRPDGVIAEGGDGVVKLRWFMPTEPDPLAGSVSYNIYWSSGSSGGLDLLDTVNDTSYAHTGLVNGRSYRYQVAGVNDEGEGHLSDLAVCVPDLLPSRPTALSASPQGDREVYVSWSEPSDWGSGDSHTYSIHRGTSPWEVELLASGLTGVGYTDSDLPEFNATYHYRVVTHSSKGTGGVELVSVDVPAAPPSFPLSLSALSKRGSVELTWEPPSDNGGECVCCYAVYRTPEGGERELIAEHIMECEYLDDTAQPDVTYEYTVAARNSAGMGTLSTPVETYVVAPPPADSGLGASGRGLPFSVLGVVGAVIIIGGVMVGRLSLATYRAERRRD